MKRLLQILAILVLIIILSACNECHTTHKNSEWVEIEISNHSGTHIYGNIAYGVTAFRVLGRKPVIKTKMKLK